MTTEQEVKATLERAKHWLAHAPRREGAFTLEGDILINDLVQLVESLGDKSIARTGEPLGERGEVAFACKCRFTREPNGELLGKVTQITECNFHSWQRDAAIDAAMGAAPITRAPESQEVAFPLEPTRAMLGLIAGEYDDGKKLTMDQAHTVYNALRALARTASPQKPAPESALKEAQWVSVPLEPTPAMQQAGVKELRNPYWQGVDYNRTCAIYRAMLAARDKPQPHE